MTTITATTFKTNFKHFGDMVSKGERLLIKRPKNEPNLIVLNENEYKEINRLLNYYKKLSESSNSSSDKRNIIGIAKGKISYPDNINDMDKEIAADFFSKEEDFT